MDELMDGQTVRQIDLNQYIILGNHEVYAFQDLGDRLALIPNSPSCDAPHFHKRNGNYVSVSSGGNVITDTLLF
jgi:hypothetical protein